MTTRDLQRAEAIKRFAADRPLAHRVLFKHRHPQESPPFHDEMIDAWHSPHKYLQFWAFRGAAKSTTGEEAIALAAIFQEFHNCVIVGSSQPRAMERLESIKVELETNDHLHELFGDVKGHTWAEDKIVLKNQVIIQAYGRGQKMRGMKFINWRPDLWWYDDVDEDEESRNSEVYQKTVNWHYHTVFPARDPSARFRVTATPREINALPGRLYQDRGWKTMIYPIEYVGFDAERVPQWPERFPLAEIDEMKDSYDRQGKSQLYRQEFMCEIDTGRAPSFKRSQFKVEPQVRTWQAVYAMVDPARTTDVNTSATTGYAVWSWIGSKLVVWEADGKFDKPDQIISRIFTIDERYRPVFIGFEKTGLSEWAMQPIRSEMARRGHALPLRGLDAPKGKIDFILGLQPFAEAGDIVLAADLPDLLAQFESFPKGRIDVPNALAYALKMRPGLPIYEDFSASSVVADAKVNAQKPYWLALNAERGHVAAVLAQLQDGRILVLADWMLEGEPVTALPLIMQEARMEAKREPRLVVHPQHFDLHNNLGLAQAARLASKDTYKGAPPERGRDEMRRLTRQHIRGEPGLQILSTARWTANGFAAGYARQAAKRGGLEELAEENQYRTLMEALESFLALGSLAIAETDGNDRNWATARDGSRYVSALRR